MEYVIRQGGVFQMENAAVAVESARVLCNRGFEKISDKTIREGIFNSCWKGRFELVSKSVRVGGRGA